MRPQPLQRPWPGVPGHRLSASVIPAPVAGTTTRLHCCHVSHQATTSGPGFAAQHTQRSAATPSPAAPSGRDSRLRVICMAHPRRVAKVASQIQREVSKMLIEDEVMVRNITPERAGGLLELSALLSVTDVYVANDLQYVKIYVSIYSDELGKQRAMRNLKRLEPYVRRQMGQRVPLRLTPVYIFEYDDAQEEYDLMTRMIGEEDMARYTREIAQETQQQAPATSQALTGSSEPAVGPRTKASETATSAEPDDGFLAVGDLASPEQGDVPGDEVSQVYTRSMKRYEGYNRNALGPFDMYFGDYEEPAPPKRRPKQGQKGKGGSAAAQSR